MEYCIIFTIIDGLFCGYLVGVKAYLFERTTFSFWNILVMLGLFILSSIYIKWYLFIILYIIWGISLAIGKKFANPKGY